MTNAEKLELYPVSVTMLSEDEGGGFFAWFTNIGASLSGEGLTRQEAIQDLMDASESYLEVLDERGVELPEVPATPDWTMLSGRVTLRLPRSLHSTLLDVSQMEGVSLNSCIVNLIQAGLTAILRKSLVAQHDVTHGVSASMPEQRWTQGDFAKIQNQLPTKAPELPDSWAVLEGKVS